MPFFTMPWRFRRSAAVSPPPPDGTTKRRLLELRKHLHANRSICVSGTSTGIEKAAARKHVEEMTERIKLLPTEAGTKLREARRDFDVRAGSFQAGCNLLFQDPENSLKDPRAPPTAGVNHVRNAHLEAAVGIMTITIHNTYHSFVFDPERPAREF